MRKLNGCHSKPRPTAQTLIAVQDGWIYVGAPGTPSFSRIPRIVLVAHAMTTACQYSKSTPDPACALCPHINIA